MVSRLELVLIALELRAFLAWVHAPTILLGTAFLAST
jgi:hypothetical protein